MFEYVWLEAALLGIRLRRRLGLVLLDVRRGLQLQGPLGLVRFGPLARPLRPLLLFGFLLRSDKNHWLDVVESC